eukprot:Lankesteria_metandrocarpae@DN2608_c0_g1_i1.p1
MAVARPNVTVFDAAEGGKSVGTVVMPHVMMAPIRPDLVRYVHTNQSKNFRQPHGVNEVAGYETSAESWGTGRAVARIPRVAGGGTHRAGQGAFGNMCRGGGMFSPKKTWRRWHRKINLTERRHAVASAIAASAVPGLVMARGHKVEDVREVPIVVSDDMQKIKRTSQAIALLNQLGCGKDLARCKDSIHIRTGRGKMRNRRYVCRRGPLVIYGKSEGCSQGFRAVPGVDMLNVEALNLLKIAPGGTLGRLCVWTESAITRLDELFGEQSSDTSEYKGYTLPRAVMTNADLSRIINSTEVQSVLNPAKAPPTSRSALMNPLRNRVARSKLDPAGAVMRKRRRLASNAERSEHQYLSGKAKETLPERKKAADFKRARLAGNKKELYSKVEATIQARLKDSAEDSTDK